MVILHTSIVVIPIIFCNCSYCVLLHLLAYICTDLGFEHIGMCAQFGDLWWKCVQHHNHSTPRSVWHIWKLHSCELFFLKVYTFRNIITRYILFSCNVIFLNVVLWIIFSVHNNPFLVETFKNKNKVCFKIIIITRHLLDLRHCWKVIEECIISYSYLDKTFVQLQDVSFNML